MKLLKVIKNVIRLSSSIVCQYTQRYGIEMNKRSEIFMKTIEQIC